MVLAAILLTGGRGSRLGGLDKSAIRLEGRTLLDRALEALQGVPTVVVGSAAARPGVVVVREDPPFGGPAAAVVAGLAALPGEAEEVLLLAVDVPRLPEAVRALHAASLETDGPSGADGAIGVDGEGRRQWLLARCRTASLRAAADRLGDPSGRSLRALLGGLDLVEVPLPTGVAADVDTVTDARRAGVVLPGEETPVADETGDVLDAWWARLSAALRLEDVPADRDAILDLAGDAAHAVVRPAAPLTTFLAGYAAGRAGGSAEDVADALARARAATEA